MPENLPAVTAHLLDLYRGPLRDIRFPDADEARLLESVDVVSDARAAVMRAELAVAAARSVLEEKERALAQETERTLAYARIYAAERPELRAALDAMPAGHAQKRTRGRPRKVTALPPVEDVAAE